MPANLSEHLSASKLRNGRARCGQEPCFRRTRAISGVRNSQTYVPVLKKTLLIPGFLEIYPYLRDTINETFFMKQSFFLLSLLALLLAACSSRPRKAAATDERPLMTVTIEPLRYFTEALAGDRFRVVSMVPKGASPETYDPTPSQLMDLSESAAYLCIGYIGFEQAWLDRLGENAPHLRFFDLSEGIDLIHDTEHAHDGHGVEPHIWNSAPNALRIAGNLTNALIAIDPVCDSLYRQRFDSLAHVILHTDSLCRAMLEQPGADRTFLIYHPALSYFARDYGLRQIPIEAGGKEPSPAYLKELVDVCREETVHVIFVQPEFDRRNAELIAKQTGARVEPINPLSYDWPQEMLHVAKALSLPADTLNQKK